MPLQRIKMIISAVWAALVIAVAVVIGATGTVALALAAIGLLPPLALLLLWNDPKQTLSESIDRARR